MIQDKDGVIRSAIGILAGDVNSKTTINGYDFYWDNVMAECTIKPGFCREQVVANIRECLTIYAGLVRPNRLLIKSAWFYPQSELNTEGAKKVGCSPDWCAYDMKMCAPPNEQIEGSNLRSCGGHIHLGSENPKNPVRSSGHEAWQVIYMLDLFLGIPSLFIDCSPESTARRNIYGQAGRYREKPYGVEYRTLGNFWLASPVLVEWVYDVSRFAVEFVREGRANDLWKFNLDKFFTSQNRSDAWTCSYNHRELKRSIDDDDKLAAKRFFEFGLELMPKPLVTRTKKLAECSSYDLYKEWRLG